MTRLLSVALFFATFVVLSLSGCQRDSGYLDKHKGAVNREREFFGFTLGQHIDVGNTNRHPTVFFETDLKSEKCSYYFFFPTEEQTRGFPISDTIFVLAVNNENTIDHIIVETSELESFEFAAHLYDTIEPALQDWCRSKITTGRPNPAYFKNGRNMRIGRCFTKEYAFEIDTSQKKPKITILIRKINKD